MSGLYNLVFGVNPLAEILLHLLGVDYKTVQRFRDCFLNEAGTEIVIYTRTGGNNRADFDNSALRKLPGFIAEEDDAFDNTYALFRFEVPVKASEKCKLLGPQIGVNPAKRWKEMIKAMESQVGDRRV